MRCLGYVLFGIAAMLILLSVIGLVSLSAVIAAGYLVAWFELSTSSLPFVFILELCIAGGAVVGVVACLEDR